MPKNNNEDCSLFDFDSVDNPEEVEEENYIELRQNFEKDIANIWGYSKKGMESYNAAMSMLATKHGLYAKVPIVCKGDKCPYCNSCKLLDYNLAPIGEKCPMEASEINLRMEAYKKDFDLDMSSFTDKSIVSEIITLDIIGQRCKALMSKEINPIIEVTSGVSENGEEYTHPEISQAFELYDKTLYRREKLFEKMLATRSDKKKYKVENEGANEKTLMEKIVDMANNGGFVVPEKPQNIIDIEESKQL